MLPIEVLMGVSPLARTPQGGRNRNMDRRQKAKMMILRGLGYTTQQIGDLEEFDVTRSAISKQLKKIRQHCREWDKKIGEHNGRSDWGYQRVFFELLLDSEEMDYNSVIAFGNQKYVYENLLFQGMSRTHALRYSTGAEAAQNPPWISNPDFDGDVSSARNFLWSVENE